MGANCCTGGKGAVIDDSVSRADLEEQRRGLTEMETKETRSDSTEETGGDSTRSSEHEAPSPTLSIKEVLEKFSAVSREIQEGTSSGIRESLENIAEEAEEEPSLSNILWSTDSFSGQITNGYYALVPEKRLTLFRSNPTSSELRALGDVNLKADVIQIDLEGDRNLVSYKALANGFLVGMRLDQPQYFSQVIKKIGKWVAFVQLRDNQQSRKETTQSSQSRGFQQLGDIKRATCCSRAILFKVLADHLGVESKLVVVFPGDLQHHLSVVVVQGNEEKFVDLMGVHGDLIPMSSEAIYEAHTSTKWNAACHLPLGPNRLIDGAGPLETTRMMRSPSATPENAIAREMRVIGSSSKQSSDIWNEVLDSPMFQDKALLPCEKWNIDISEVKIGALIGCGCFAKVYRGKWIGIDVAIKVFLEQDLKVETIKDFCYEINIISRVCHPNVVLFLGACTKPPQLSLVTELMGKGSLYHLLYSRGEKETLTWKKKLKMLRDICKGLMAVHRMGIVHRDLKSSNCLLSSDLTVKICDFGLSRIMKYMTVKDAEPAGTPQWMAPELIRNESFSEKCDIYSFGVIMWELSTLSMPWNGVPLNEVIHNVAFKGARLEIPDVPISKLIAACWSEPEQRPSCKEILEQLAICEFSL